MVSSKKIFFLWSRWLLLDSFLDLVDTLGAKLQAVADHRKVMVELGSLLVGQIRADLAQHEVDLFGDLLTDLHALFGQEKGTLIPFARARLANDVSVCLQKLKTAGYGGLVLLAELAKLGGGQGILGIQVIQAGDVNAPKPVLGHFLVLDLFDVSVDLGNQNRKSLEALGHMYSFHSMDNSASPRIVYHKLVEMSTSLRVLSIFVFVNFYMKYEDNMPYFSPNGGKEGEKPPSRLVFSPRQKARPLGKRAVGRLRDVSLVAFFSLQGDEYRGQQGNGGGYVLSDRQLFPADGADDGGADHDASRDQGILDRGGEGMLSREGDEQEEITQAVEYAVTRDEQDILALYEGDLSVADQEPEGGDHHGYHRRPKHEIGAVHVGERRRLVQLGDHARHAVQHEHGKVVQEGLPVLLAGFDVEKDGHHDEGAADQLESQLVALVEKEDAQEEGKDHAAQHGKNGIDRQVGHREGLEAVVPHGDARQGVDRGHAQGEPGEFNLESRDQEHHEDDDETFIQGKDLGRLHARAVGLLKPLVEQELKGEQDGGYDDQNVIQALHGGLLYAPGAGELRWRRARFGAPGSS